MSKPFDQFQFVGNTWSLKRQLAWLQQRLDDAPPAQPRFVFLNVGETHVPYWHCGANWDAWPSPCVPFGDAYSSSAESARRQISCLKWVDSQLNKLLHAFRDSTILVCADHGDCWGENGLWEHGISHASTLTVPLLLQVKGKPIGSFPKLFLRDRFYFKLLQFWDRKA